MDLENTLAATGGPAGAREPDDEGDELARGAAVGRFILLGTLGAGGMGVVYAAYDPELDRKVALKLLLPRAGGTSNDGGRARLVREAQALAKLSHPNVVAVHDVGTHGDSVWLAMEFVAGQTLTAWAQTRRRWSEVLPLLADVARGVAAAHAAGLVHRDLKPDNVMIGNDGRVRVMDFGLAHGRGLAGAEPALASTLVSGMQAPSEAAGLASRLTAVGAVQGTPAYMAPEQWQGREAQPATDQFGWSVMAWELLFGERPFAGETMMNLAAAVLAGQRRPPPRGSRAPKWLRRVIERGLATEPARRWPTMAALLSALERGKARARARTGAVVVAGLALLGAGVEGYRRWDIARRVAVCEVAGADIDEAWNDGARQRLREAFTATGVRDAGTSADRVMPWLDERAGAWRRARTDVCLNADVRGLWGEELLDRAMWCLEDRQLELASLVAELGRANGTAVQRSVTAVASLRTADACLDEDVLRRQPAPPTQGREALRDVRARLSRAQSLGLAGNFKEALAVATQAREQATAVLDWPPLLATTRALEGNLLERTGAYEQAEAASHAAYFEAGRSGAWDVAARAAIDLVLIVGSRRARHGEGREWAEHAEMALAHAGDRAGLREARRLNNLAGVHRATGAYAEARALHERALEIREGALGPGHPDVAQSLNNLANLHEAIGDYTEARALHERALAIKEQALGPRHIDVAASLNNLAGVLITAGAYAEARADLERALEIWEQALGPGHPDVARALTSLGAVHMATGARAEARTALERALAIMAEALGPEHPDVARSLSNLADVHMATGAYTEARTLLERALAIQERALGPEHPDVAISLSSVAAAHLAIGAHAAARPLLERALVILEQALGSEHPEVAMSLNYLADVHLEQSRPQDALLLLERAVAIYIAQEGAQIGEMEAHFNLARALVATGGDRVRALALARTARNGLREAGAGPVLAEVERWLAGHP